MKDGEKGFTPYKQGIKEMGSKLCYFLASLIETMWSQMEKCAFPGTKSTIKAFGQVIVQVVTEEEQRWQTHCTRLNPVLSYYNGKLFFSVLMSENCSELLCSLLYSKLDSISVVATVMFGVACVFLFFFFK